MQLFEEVPVPIPSRTQGHELVTSWVVAMKYKNIIFHPINLREGYLIVSQLQERGKVEKIIGRLDPVG